MSHLSLVVIISLYMSVVTHAIFFSLPVAALPVVVVAVVAKVGVNVSPVLPPAGMKEASVSSNPKTIKKRTFSAIFLPSLMVTVSEKVIE